jgi:hypothetical protein
VRTSKKQIAIIFDKKTKKTAYQKKRERVYWFAPMMQNVEQNSVPSEQRSAELKENLIPEIVQHI